MPLYKQRINSIAFCATRGPETYPTGQNKKANIIKLVLYIDCPCLVGDLLFFPPPGSVFNRRSAERRVGKRGWGTVMARVADGE